MKKSKAPTLLLPRKDARYFEQKAKWIDKVKALKYKVLDDFQKYENVLKSEEISEVDERWVI